MLPALVLVLALLVLLVLLMLWVLLLVLLTMLVLMLVRVLLLAAWRDDVQEYRVPGTLAGWNAPTRVRTNDLNAPWHIGVWIVQGKPSPMAKETRP